MTAIRRAARAGSGSRRSPRRAESPDAALLVHALERLPVGLALLDREGRVALGNEALALLLGREVGDLRGRDFFGDLAPSLDESAGAAFRQGLRDGALDRDLECRLAGGERALDVRVQLRLVEPGQALLLLEDNSCLKRTERAIEAALLEAQDQATRDALTGLHNRRFVEMMLPSELARAQRHAVPLSLCVVDVDHFKLVNDLHGHPMGDRVLVRLAAAMQRMRRVSDTCARLGGEEFCLLLPHTGRPAAEAAAERVHRVVRALRFEEVPGLRVTVSIGIATTPTPLPAGSSYEAMGRQLMARADGALYEAKRGGRDRSASAP